MTTVRTIDYNPKYQISRTGSFSHKGLALCKLGQQIFIVQRPQEKNGEYKLLYFNFTECRDSRTNQVAKIVRVTLDTKDRLIGVDIDGIGPLAGLGVTVIAEGSPWTEDKKNR